MRSKFFLVLVVLVPFWAGGCEDKSQDTASNPEPKSATQLQVMIGREVPISGRMFNNTAVVHHPTPIDNSLAWVVPAGWQEKHGTGLRLVSFNPVDHPDDVDAYIVLLGGMSGTVDANIYRWADQVNIPLNTEQEVNFIKEAGVVKTNLGQDARIFDFTTLQKGQPLTAASMITAMIKLDDVTVFVKMTGSIDAVTRNQGNFKALVGSIYKAGNHYLVKT